MILVNTDYITGKQLETITLVKGSTIQTKHFGKDLAQSFKTLVGGELTNVFLAKEDIYYGGTHTHNAPDPDSEKVAEGHLP